MLLRLFVFVAAVSVVGLRRLDVNGPRLSKTSLISKTVRETGWIERSAKAVKEKKDKAEHFIREKLFAKQRAKKQRQEEEARKREEKAAEERAHAAAKAVEKAKKKEEAAAEAERAAAHAATVKAQKEEKAAREAEEAAHKAEQEALRAAEDAEKEAARVAQEAEKAQKKAAMAEEKLEERSHPKVKANRNTSGAKVFISGEQVFGTGVSSASVSYLGMCDDMPTTLAKPKAPFMVKVCGSSVFVQLHLLNDCDTSYKVQKVGKCDTSLPPTDCEEIGTETESVNDGLEHYQTYQILPCQ